MPSSLSGAVQDSTVYSKPALEKFGTFRELTRLGFTSASDGASIFGSTGCRTDLSRYGYGVISLGCPTSPPAGGGPTSS